MKNTFEQQIYEIFGTTDPKELRRLSKDAEQYQQLAQKEALRHAAGRKPAFSLPQIIQMAAMQQQGKSIAEIARTFQRVIQKCRAASTKVGGTGIRYTVQICGKPTFLFDEENGKWFVEAKT